MEGGRPVPGWGPRWPGLVRDTGIGGGSDELRKGGCTQKAEEELQATSVDSSARSERGPARGHASTCLRGDPTSSGRDAGRSSSLARTSSHRRAVLRPTGRGPALRRPEAGGSSRLASDTGVTLARVLQKSWTSPFNGVCCFFFFGWGLEWRFACFSVFSKEAINQSGVCTNSHTRPAEGGAEGPGGGAGPGGVGE